MKATKQQVESSESLQLRAAEIATAAERALALLETEKAKLRGLALEGTDESRRAQRQRIEDAEHAHQDLLLAGEEIEKLIRAAQATENDAAIIADTAAYRALVSQAAEHFRAYEAAARVIAQVVADLEDLEIAGGAIERRLRAAGAAIPKPMVGRTPAGRSLTGVEALRRLPMLESGGPAFFVVESRTRRAQREERKARDAERARQWEEAQERARAEHRAQQEAEAREAAEKAAQHNAYLVQLAHAADRRITQQFTVRNP
jgi:hypothetical protein